MEDLVNETVCTEQKEVKDISLFAPRRVLSENFGRKRICVEGTISKEAAIVILEQNPLTEESFKDLCTVKSFLKQKAVNDLYGSYDCVPENKLRGIKITIVHPATPDDIKKYESHPTLILSETWTFYYDITLPYISRVPLNLEWVYDILDHKTGKETILFEDPSSLVGFVIVPHLLWDQKDVEELHLVAIVHSRNIKSIRDLTTEHLPLLKNVEEKTVEFIKEKYNLTSTRLAVFLHYQPSYYHLHIHFANLQCSDAGFRTEEAHLLSRVINNIELVPKYYQKATLSFIFNPLDSWICDQQHPCLNDLLKETRKIKEKTCNDVCSN